MAYYRIRVCLDANIMGKIPQIKEVIYNSNVQSPDFVGNIHFKKVEFAPFVANPVLYPKANRTDLIGSFGMGSTSKFLISDKLREIFIKYKKSGIQFFQCSLFQNGIEYDNYFLSNIYQSNPDYIDYKKSIIIHEKRAEDFYTTYNIENHEIIINSFEDFNSYKDEARKNEEIVIIKKLSLQSTIYEDLFMLRDIEGGWGYFVSEKLKEEIENAGCTGIEFQPGELSYDEWLAPGGEREKVYGKTH